MFKKLIFSIAFVAISATTFAQHDSYSRDIQKLMEVRNGTAMYKTILDELPSKVSSENVESFKQNLIKQSEKSQKDARKMLRKEFTHTQINEIFAEMSSDTKKYSPQTIKFIKLWQRHKATFSNQVKTLL